MPVSEQILLALAISAFPIFGLILAYESWPGRRIRKADHRRGTNSFVQRR